APQRLPFLRRALKERDAANRRAAASALASADEQAFLLALLPALRDQDPTVRASAITGLEKAKQPEATRALGDRFLDETESGLRKRIAAALAEAPDEDLFAAVAAWDPRRRRDEVVMEFIPIAAARSSTAAVRALVDVVATVLREDVANAALQSL